MSIPLTPLGRRLFHILFLVGTAVAVISSATIMWINYQSGVKRYQFILQQISDSYKDSVTYSLWAYDIRQLDAQLQGILNFPSIVYAQIDSNGEIITKKGDLYQSVAAQMVIPLVYKNNHTDITIGYLRLNQSYAPLYQSLITQAITTVVGQTIMFVFLMIIVLFILHHLVTKRLGVMAQWAMEFSLENLDNQLSLGSTNNTDELTQVAQAINHMRETLKEDLAQREREQDENKELHQQLSLVVDNVELGICRYYVKEHRFDCNLNFANHLGSNISELNTHPEPFQYFLNLILGDTAEEQLNQIHQLLSGNITRLKSRYLLNTPAHLSMLDINFQILSYLDNCPDKILIYSIDKTEEFSLKNKIEFLKDSKELEFERRTEDFKAEISRLRESKDNFRREVRKLRMAQHPKHIQALNNLILDYLKKWHECISDDEFTLWKSFLNINFYNTLKPIDLSIIFKRLTQDIADKYKNTFFIDAPFSLIAEEDETVLNYLLHILLQDKFFEKSQKVNLKLSIADNYLKAFWIFDGEFSAIDLDEMLSMQLAQMITQMRYNGEIGYKKSDKKLELSLIAPFRT